METVARKVEELVAGNRVDLKSCPFLKTHPSAPFEFAQVALVQQETPGTVVVGYEGIDHVGYPVGTVLQVRVPKDVPDPVVAVQPVGQAGKWVEWNISQNLTDRFGDVNPHNAANKPLELLEDNEALFEALLSQMWDECTFIVRKDGNFGILFEVEYASRESEGEDDNPDFLAKLKSHDEVVDELLAAMVPLTEQFPGVLFAVPDRKVIINDRPAAWAFVPNGLLNDEQRKELGMALLSL